MRMEMSGLEVGGVRVIDNYGMRREYFRSLPV
jgi:hypothetical protein